ncbi:aminotransferase class IV [Dyadobacter sandarakinus]|uniref:Aminotransferase class IV n=1 Tax=Dyadobacter sandarakinus TaxID=2747268 RepID=A0ABX7IB76_9BACT|nr:aminotransferase class IV [Dyadobacter sandarakinus]QRR03230.1 aminotransferase class IV [Dyadobacter sandarakinus]
MPHTLCIETICIENRQFRNLPYHEARLNRTRRELWGYHDMWNLAELVSIPDTVDHTLHKCRIAYGKEIDDVRWETYTFRQIRQIRRMYSDTIDYRYKYDDRMELNALFSARRNADEILIIKNGLVTDSLYCNVAFYDGNTWLTPSTPLLPGTQRAALLNRGMIREAIIREADIGQYSRIKLFNAMIDWDNAPELDVCEILQS